MIRRNLTDLALVTSIVTLGHADDLYLPDESVDLIVTSPPYFNLRSYQDNGEHYDGQIGAEESSVAYLDALIDCTREWMRVLKPSGSIFVNLGDKYGKEKGLGMLPARYAIRCADELGLIQRAEIIWSKPNGLPESVTDRVRRSHEQVFHFVKQSRYYASVDEFHPGKMPGSVWSIATVPLRVPANLGIDHFAAYPPELVRSIILGWSPREVCSDCGEGRRRVRDGAWQYGNPGNVNAERSLERAHALGLTAADVAEKYGTKIKSGGNHADGTDSVHARALALAPLLGGRLYAEQLLPLVKRAWGGYACACPDPSAPAVPGVVLDPFGGTGTSALVASVHGRVGISLDLSADYCRLAQWRTADVKQREKAARTPNPKEN